MDVVAAAFVDQPSVLVFWTTLEDVCDYHC